MEGDDEFIPESWSLTTGVTEANSVHQVMRGVGPGSWEESQAI